jgi:hypothetical protein
MLTKLSQEVSKINERIKSDLKHFKVTAIGLCRSIPDPANEGNFNYFPEDDSHPVSLDERSDLHLWHTLDSSTVETTNPRNKRDVFTVAIVVFTKKTSIDIYLKSLLVSLKGQFEYTDAEYTASTILNTYNISKEFFKFEYNLFVIRYTLKVPIENLNCVICIPRPDAPEVSIEDITLTGVSLNIK